MDGWMDGWMDGMNNWWTDWCRNERRKKLMDGQREIRRDG